ncbi:CSC1-like protein RXW8 isoform X2 [Typha latifolia]|uniref:CSC1-like protein RXW8 isoform X2 n=1 Tax=Typha latifolia TaxID=4733 RepID=UPI003C2CF8E9
MKISALLTSAGINIGLCALLLSLYSILRKQPGNVNVYFGRRLAQEHSRLRDSFILERFVPSPSWIMKALQYKEEEILDIAGLDAVVFLRILVFSTPTELFWTRYSSWADSFNIIRCIYYWKCRTKIKMEYKNIARMRLVHVTRSPLSPSHFTVLVRGIPKSTEQPFHDAVQTFFTKYHASSYLSHQMVYKVGKVQKIMSGAKKAYNKCAHLKDNVVDQRCRPSVYRCCLCGGPSNSFQLYHDELEVSGKETDDHSDPNARDEECASAFVFFKTRYAALVSSEVLQTSNPMLWVTDMAPEPDDVYWSNLWLPYRQLWIRRIATLLASIVLMFLFLIPVTFVQGLSQLDTLQQRLPFLKGILKKPFISQLVTGYLPSVVLQLFLYAIPPTMMLFSAVEGPISHSGRKKSACYKVLYFTIWNVFFVNVLSGSVISQINVLSSPKDIPSQLAKAVPRQATFFITYVLTSGWASLSSEVMQLFSLIWNFIRKYIFRKTEDPTSVPSFPYHTEIPKLLFFGLLGFTCSILAPLILPFLLVYYFLGYIVYRNQILNVYCSRYETGGSMWPIVHNTTVFSLVLTQIIALGVFGLKESPVAAGFMIPLVILTLLFNEYCRKRFHPLFKSFSAQDLIDMDREDEQSGRMDQIHEQLILAYCQFPPDAQDKSPRGDECEGEVEGHNSSIEIDNNARSQVSKDDSSQHPTLGTLPVVRLQKAVKFLSMIFTLQKRSLSI